MVIKLVGVDLDGTILNYKKGKYNSSYEAVFHAIGKEKEHMGFVEYYLWKKDLYDEWYQKETALLKGVSVSYVESKVLPPIYSDGTREMCIQLKNLGLVRGLLTSGMDIIARYAERDLGLDFCECNEVFRENGFFTGLGKSNVDLWNKKANMMDVCNRFNVKPREVAVVGDHENELDLFEIAGLSIAYRPKTEKVSNAADYVVDNLIEIPKIIMEFQRD